MFDYLVNENGLKSVMKEHGLVLPEDLDFIKEQIAGPLDTEAAQGQKVTSVKSVCSITATKANVRFRAGQYGLNYFYFDRILKQWGFC